MMAEVLVSAILARITTTRPTAREMLLEQGADFVGHLRASQGALRFDADMQAQGDVDGQAFSALPGVGVRRAALNPLIRGVDLPRFRGAADYFYHNNSAFMDWWENRTQLNVVEYSTFAFTREALRFLDHTSEPFFLLVSYQAAHKPFQTSSDNVCTDYNSCNNVPGLLSHYQAVIGEMDDSIGEIVSALPPNTYVFFFSDNGGIIPPANNAPLRSGKGTVYEGGIRIPSIAAGPDVVHTTNKGLHAVIDFMPTILALTGTTKPPGVTFDGRSFATVLRGTGGLPTRRLFFTQDATWAVRDGLRWKLVRGSDGRKSLYDLTADIGELHNVASTHATVVSNLTSAFNAWKAQVAPSLKLTDNGPLCFPQDSPG